jgi:glycosyltransferase involved in cell wall biosynthesis
VPQTVIVVDTRNSALAIVANSRARIWKSHVIYSDDFHSPVELIKYLIRNNFTNVLFAWRGLLWEGFELNGFSRAYSKLIEKAYLHLLVPDYLGLEKRYFQKEENALAAVHGYSVTSKDLKSKYDLHFGIHHSPDILHDIPNLELVRSCRTLTKVDNSVIWVGNSRWGENFGYRDHKGLEKVLKPLITKSNNARLGFEFTVVDTVLERHSNAITVEMIAKNSILLVCSEHEGTGLPILEALGVGTLPITTRVGIAEEVLLGDLSELIVKRDSTDFFDRLALLKHIPQDLRKNCIHAFETYISNISEESIEWKGYQVPVVPSSFRVRNQIFVRAKWLFRYFRANSNR